MSNPELLETCIGGRIFRWGFQTYVMGVLNVTPDSFSGDGLEDIHSCVKQALAMEESGADIIDVGGESTRPPGLIYGEGAKEISADNELQRIIPVISAIRKHSNIPISVDTYKASVAEKAINAGANMINDIWGLKKNPELAKISSRKNVPLVIMHNQIGTKYVDLIQDIITDLQISINLAIDYGVKRSNIIVDPGFGFGKLPSHNFEILRNLKILKSQLSYPMLIGTSRKSTIGKVLNKSDPKDRIFGTAATVALSIASGVDFIRVHDVEEMKMVSLMSDAIVRSCPDGGVR
jgi:dihydropteroate synthase